jgi:hypothetical protein
MDYLVEQIRAIEPKLETYQQLGLPMQIIHGERRARHQAIAQQTSGVTQPPVAAVPQHCHACQRQQRRWQQLP